MSEKRPAITYRYPYTFRRGHFYGLFCVFVLLACLLLSVVLTPARHDPQDYYLIFLVWVLFTSGAIYNFLSIRSSWRSPQEIVLTEKHITVPSHRFWRPCSSIAFDEITFVKTRRLNHGMFTNIGHREGRTVIERQRMATEDYEHLMRNVENRIEPPPPIKSEHFC